MVLFQELHLFFSLIISRKPEESFAFSPVKKAVIFVFCHALGGSDEELSCGAVCRRGGWLYPVAGDGGRLPG